MAKTEASGLTESVLQAERQRPDNRKVNNLTIPSPAKALPPTLRDAQDDIAIA